MLRNKLILILILIIPLCYANTLYSQIVVVVNKNNPIDNFSLKEIQKIYLGEKTTFSASTSIVIGVNTELKEDFIKILFNWSDINYKKHWMKRIFSGENFIAPKEFDRLNALKNFIVQNEGSIAFINYSDKSEDFKILAIDGKLPGSKDYPLK